jgi:hypothetical protein
MKHFLHLSKLWTICHFISIETIDVTCIWRCLLCFWFGCVASMVATVVCSFFFLHVSTLWFVIPQFVHCLSIFLVLFCVFASATYLVFYGTNNALLAFVVVIPSSHNIVASLCYCSVDRFNHVVVILRYDYKPVLNTIVKKLFVVGTYKPWANF